MAYSYFADPGQVKEPRKEALPLRAHKSWQYPLPIRRYDHYCKWLDNVIGLLNHREFVLMVGGLVMIALIGIVVDVWLAVLIAKKSFCGGDIIVLLHLGYSLGLLNTAGPIFKIHFGLVSRNETAKEWKKKQHYVANNTTIGDNIPVEELDDDEYNEFFDDDAFVYSPSMNSFDKGCLVNCFNFWCSPRWIADAKGEF
eukprot:Skav230823  [mRNA]  locus=scaffold851:444816:445409:+ [translate_table: standard]